MADDIHTGLVQSTALFAGVAGALVATLAVGLVTQVLSDRRDALTAAAHAMAARADAWARYVATQAAGVWLALHTALTPPPQAAPPAAAAHHTHRTTTPGGNR